MKINKTYDLIISEPFGLVSPETNENVFSIKIEDKTNFNRLHNKNKIKIEEAYLVKIKVPFKIREFRANYLVLEYRKKEECLESFNVYYIPDELIPKFQELDSIMDKLVFIIIGSAKEKKFLGII